MSNNDLPAQCKQPKPGYFGQYRNPGKDTSGKNGPYGHPSDLTTRKHDTSVWGVENLREYDEHYLQFSSAVVCECMCWFCAVLHRPVSFSSGQRRGAAVLAVLRDGGERCEH